MKISTTNKSLLPQPDTLRRICKACSLLDAILCQEWEYRYYSYNNQWSEEEEFFQMRDGGGNEMMILFNPESAFAQYYE